MPQSVIRFTVSPRTTPCVNPGDRVTKNQCIARGSHSRLEVLNMSQLLNCKPSSVLSYLECSLGSTLQKGEPLAKRKGFLHEYEVNAEDTLEIVAIDEDQGLVTTRRFTGHEIIHKSPVNGSIKEVCEAYIDIVFDGMYVQAERVQGSVYAPIVVLHEENMYSLDDSVSGKVVVVRAQAGIMSKLMALGAKAVITTAGDVDNTIPHAILDPQTIGSLSAFDGQYVLLDGEHHCLVL